VRRRKAAAQCWQLKSNGVAETVGRAAACLEEHGVAFRLDERLLTLKSTALPRLVRMRSVRPGTERALAWVQLQYYSVVRARRGYSWSVVV
jgi:hypothetical protein